MSGRLKFLFLYFFSWIFFFEIARLVFFLVNYHEARQLPYTTNALSFWYGLRMDVAMASYLLVPVIVFVITSTFHSFFRKANAYLIYTYATLVVVLFLFFADIEVYNSWGFRMDATPLKYLSSPKEAIASISHLPLMWLVLAYILVVVIFCLLWRFLIRKIVFLLNLTAPRFVVTVILILFAALLIIPMRGGLQQTPINQSTVYFSRENFANITAINAIWNFTNSIFKNRDTKNPYRYTDQQQATQIVDALYKKSDSSLIVLRHDRPNVIIIIWESFTEKAIHTSRKGIEVTPLFNKLKQEGIYFNHLYASGDRTDKGIAAILSGYPALNKFSVIHQPAKSKKLSSLGKFFNKRGYQNYFFYGGEPEFANIKSYLLQSEYDQLVEKSDFTSREKNSKWGAHDGPVALRMIRDLSVMKQPFFASWLTLSSHEPFEIPETPVFQGEDITTKFLNSLHYTDQVVYNLVQQCSKELWWENTLMIIVADHGHPLPKPSNKLDNFKIPMLWLGGILNKKNFTVESYGSQLDVTATLASQLDTSTKDFPFSKNLFDRYRRHWAYFSFNNGFGMVQPDKFFAYDNIGSQVVEHNGSFTQKDIDTGKALQQFIYQDYLNK